MFGFGKKQKALQQELLFSDPALYQAKAELDTINEKRRVAGVLTSVTGYGSVGLLLLGMPWLALGAFITSIVVAGNAPANDKQKKNYHLALGTKLGKLNETVAKNKDATLYGKLQKLYKGLPESYGNLQRRKVIGAVVAAGFTTACLVALGTAAAVGWAAVPFYLIGGFFGLASIVVADQALSNAAKGSPGTEAVHQAQAQFKAILPPVVVAKPEVTPVTVAVTPKVESAPVAVPVAVAAPVVPPVREGELLRPRAARIGAKFDVPNA